MADSPTEMVVGRRQWQRTRTATHPEWSRASVVPPIHRAKEKALKRDAFSFCCVARLLVLGAPGVDSLIRTTEIGLVLQGTCSILGRPATASVPRKPGLASPVDRGGARSANPRRSPSWLGFASSSVFFLLSAGCASPTAVLRLPYPTRLPLGASPGDSPPRPPPPPWAASLADPGGAPNVAAAATAPARLPPPRHRRPPPPRLYGRR